MHTLRTRFKKDIVAEFLPPVRKTRKQKVVIICGGMPGSPGKKDILNFFRKKGWWAINPRYRGSWESDGKFLAKSPHQDILDILNQLPKGFQSISDSSLKNKKLFRLKPETICIIGTSFGGAAAIFASRDERVTKVFCISPVVNWRVHRKTEPLSLLAKFTKEAFGNAYRVSSNGWKKIASGEFYNPVNHVEEIDGSKLLIVHAKDDTVCPYSATKKFAAATGSKLITLPRGGHLSSSIILKPRFYKAFQKFIKS